ncbi:DUF2147 domain-containing protein [Acidiphilium sp.]|uniref:DUF2147 domain-containing protein n=1 Tax=Acidiphilium sp. TaxID=527 RepID=UPI003D04F1CF
MILERLERAWFATLILATVTVPPAHTAGPPRAPIGDWLTARDGAVVAIAPCHSGSGLCGRIVGIFLAPHAPMPKDWRGRSQCHFRLIRAAITRNGHFWRGHIIDPRNGNDYHMEFHVTPGGRLAVHGYLGLPIFGETQYWAPYHADVPLTCRIASVSPRPREPQPARPQRRPHQSE